MLCLQRPSGQCFRAVPGGSIQWWVDGRGKGEAGACEEENKTRLDLRNTGSQ